MSKDDFVYVPKGSIFMKDMGVMPHRHIIDENAAFPAKVQLPNSNSLDSLVKVG